MGKYDLVIFDVDGTILDTSEGILSAVKYTVDALGYRELGEDELYSFIGPPIQDSFKRAYNLSGDILQEIATIFRNRYKDADLLKATPYDGIHEVFRILGENNIKTAIATYKREDYAITLLKHYGFDKYTDIMHGGDHENKLKKKDIIEKCISESGITDKSRIVMIGDTDNDLIGARGIGVDFIAVTFGFGYRSKADTAKLDIAGCADTPMELLDYIL